MTDEDRFRHHRYLADVAMEDVRYVTEKDRSYGASWKLSGGRSAWFMLKRKIDRMCEMMRRPDGPPGFEESLSSTLAGSDGNFSLSFEAFRFLRDCMSAEDIFAKIRQRPSGEDGTVLAEVRDLRRYLLLVESEMMACGCLSPTTEGDRMVPRKPVTVRPPPFRPDARTRASAPETSDFTTMVPLYSGRLGHPAVDAIAEGSRKGEWDPGAPAGHDGADTAL
jgi:hypothetical protein